MTKIFCKCQKNSSKETIEDAAHGVEFVNCSKICNALARHLHDFCLGINVIRL